MLHSAEKTKLAGIAFAQIRETLPEMREHVKKTTKTFPDLGTFIYLRQKFKH